ncbi:unnamed protein product [Effrenium voratum]|nr:unnamed protein product [Effrenium voratum]
MVFAQWVALFSNFVTADQPLSNIVYNFRRHAVDIRWRDGSLNGIRTGEIQPMDSVKQQTFEGHVISVHRQGETFTLARFAMTAAQAVYAVLPEVRDKEAFRHPLYLKYMKELERPQLRATLASAGLAEAAVLDETVSASPPGFSAKFHNFQNFPVEVYWDDGSEHGVLQENISAMSSGEGHTTFEGHTFEFKRRKEGALETVERFTMRLNERNYAALPDDVSREHPQFLTYKKQIDFEREYFESTGRHWLAEYPPVPPVLHIRSSSGLGEVAHSVQLRRESHVAGVPTEMQLISLSPPAGAPRAFLIRDLLTAEECAHVVALAEPLLERSRTGSNYGQESLLRTSSTTFLNRTVSPALETMHKRFADVLGVTDDELRAAAEQLQVVRYERGQEYVPHNDHSRSFLAAQIAPI